MGRKDEIIEKVRGVAEPLAGPEGLELVDVELGGSGRTVLRLFIDRLPDYEQIVAHRLPEPEEHAGSAAEDALSEGQAVEVDEESASLLPAGDEAGGDEAGGDEDDDALGSAAIVPGKGRRPGVSLDDCARFSRIVSTALDVEDPLAGAYDLEVSSPGLDRPLRKPEHFVKYAGQKVRVRTYAPVPECADRKTFVGTLKGFDAGKVLVDVDGTLFAVPHSQISKANVEPVFD